MGNTVRGQPLNPPMLDEAYSPSPMKHPGFAGRHADYFESVA